MDFILTKKSMYNKHVWNENTIVLFFKSELKFTIMETCWSKTMMHCKQ